MLDVQVRTGGTDAASWLHDAIAALPGLAHSSHPSARQAVAVVLDNMFEAPALCSQLSGSFGKAAHLVNSLLTSHLPHVQAAAYKALVGAACIGPAALRVRAHGLLCHSAILQTLIARGLADADSKLFAAELVQAVAVEGDSDEGQKQLLPWMVWLACYEQDHMIGGTIAGITDYLQERRCISVWWLSAAVQALVCVIPLCAS